MSWVTDLWKILETVATLTKEVEHSSTELKELRRDLNALTSAVSQLKNDLAHLKETNQLSLSGFEKDGQHLKESVESRFDVLLTRLDSKITGFENRLKISQAEGKSLPPLRDGLDG